MYQTTCDSNDSIQPDLVVIMRSDDSDRRVAHELWPSKHWSPETLLSAVGVGFQTWIGQVELASSPWTTPRRSAKYLDS
jgi:hypothetical protein